MISGLILAAGSSTRMGRPKQTVLLAGRPMLEYPLLAFLSSKVGEIILVVQKRSILAGMKVPIKRVRVVVNPYHAQGLSASVKLGVREVSPRSSAVVIGLGDKPLVLGSTIDSLISAYGRSGSMIVAPVYHKRRGNPIIFDRGVFPLIEETEGDEGAKSVMRKHEDEVFEVPVNDAGILIDVDTPEDLENAERMLLARSLASDRKPREK